MGRSRQHTKAPIEVTACAGADRSDPCYIVADQLPLDEITDILRSRQYWPKSALGSISGAMKTLTVKVDKYGLVRQIDLTRAETMIVAKHGCHRHRDNGGGAD